MHHKMELCLQDAFAQRDKAVRQRDELQRELFRLKEEQLTRQKMVEELNKEIFRLRSAAGGVSSSTTAAAPESKTPLGPTSSVAPVAPYDGIKLCLQTATGTVRHCRISVGSSHSRSTETSLVVNLIAFLRSNSLAQGDVS